MTANVITYRGRSAAREVGKVLSLETAQVDRLAKVMNHFEWVDPKETLARNLNEVGLDLQHPTIQTFGRLWQSIQDLPRHLGQHSGGMVMSHGRLDDVVPLENASMPNRVVVQWDKDDCADMGIVKVDLLGLGMMSVLQDALELVNRTNDSGFGVRGSGTGKEPAPPTPQATRSKKAETSSSKRPAAPKSHERIPGAKADSGIDLAHLPPDDPAVYRMLQEADTIGIFQVESRAQMATLPRLRPERFYDIVVEVAIIRPGPIVGQMVHPFLKRRQGQETVVYPHPSLEPILARTLGVPLFQEQLLRMAMVAAGFSGGEAEELRRAFGFKRSEHRMQQIEGKLRAGMAKKAITGAAADEIIRSITSFALYGFPESHAASFALLVYASAYLKAHYPAAFYTALLNNQPMGFYHPATLVKDAQRHGVRFAPIDVQESDWTCRVDPDGRVRLGLMYVNGLRQDVGRAIAESAPNGGSNVADRVVTNADPGTCQNMRPRRSIAVRNAGVTISRCSKRHCRTDISATSARTNGGALHDRDSGLGIRDSGSDRDWGLGTGLGESNELDPEPEPNDANPEPRYSSIADLIARTRVRRDELATLADIGALNAFGYDRRSALWQVERAVRPTGELFADLDDGGKRRRMAFRLDATRQSQVPLSRFPGPSASGFRLKAEATGWSRASRAPQDRRHECRLPSRRYARCRRPSA